MSATRENSGRTGLWRIRILANWATKEEPVKCGELTLLPYGEWLRRQFVRCPPVPAYTPMVLPDGLGNWMIVSRECPPS